MAGQLYVQTATGSGSTYKEPKSGANNLTVRNGGTWKQVRQVYVYAYVYVDPGGGQIGDWEWRWVRLWSYAPPPGYVPGGVGCSQTSPQTDRKVRIYWSHGDQEATTFRLEVELYVNGTASGIYSLAAGATYSIHGPYTDGTRVKGRVRYVGDGGGKGAWSPMSYEVRVDDGLF